jgi:hypothetical protein
MTTTGTLTSTTQSIRGGTRRSAKQSLGWKEDGRPQSAGKRMHFTDRCLKWLKTRMDQGCVAVSVQLAPFQHHSPFTSSNDDDESRDTIIQRDSYDCFPVHPRIDVQCTFCGQPAHISQSDSHHWKNPYVRKSWSPLCRDCAGKTLTSKG